MYVSGVDAMAVTLLRFAAPRSLADLQRVPRECCERTRREVCAEVGLVKGSCTTGGFITGHICTSLWHSRRTRDVGTKLDTFFGKTLIKLAFLSHHLFGLSCP